MIWREKGNIKMDAGKLDRMGGEMKLSSISVQFRALVSAAFNVPVSTWSASHESRNEKLSKAYGFLDICLNYNG